MKAGDFVVGAGVRYAALLPDAGHRARRTARGHRELSRLTLGWRGYRCQRCGRELIRGTRLPPGGSCAGGCTVVGRCFPGLSCGVTLSEASYIRVNDGLPPTLTVGPQCDRMNDPVQRRLHRISNPLASRDYGHQVGRYGVVGRDKQTAPKMRQ